MTYDGSNLGQDGDKHESEVAGVTPIDVDDEASRWMNVDVNAENSIVLNVAWWYAMK